MNFQKNLFINRIECYDIAHISGNFPTASMVTFIGGEEEKCFYRHFKIRQISGASDTASLLEVAIRREKYLSSWGVPDLIIVDGGRAQVNVFLKVFKRHNIAVIGLAKRFETFVIPRSDGSFKELRVPHGPILNLVQRLRNEAHRFARRYHHLLLKKDLFKSP